MTERLVKMAKELTEEEEKFLAEAFKKTFNYDPDEDEVDARYDDDFDDEVMEMLDEKFKNKKR